MLLAGGDHLGYDCREDDLGELYDRFIIRRDQAARKVLIMHYRNGREAHNGDKVISLAGYGTGPVNINAIGILFDAKPGNDYCNGSIASIIGGPVVSACMCDCLHLDDVAALLAEKGWDKRPAGK